MQKETLTQLTDEELVQRYRNSHETKYIGELYQRYTHLVFGVCLKYLKNNTEAEDTTMQIFEKLIEEKTFDPLFVTHCPKELVPLAKQNLEDDSLVDVYELIINGQEISPGYSELNDPLIQRQRLLEQAGEETQKIDEEFLLALEHGMPPAGGFGLGIDRLTMLLTGAESIRDVVLFPLLKPKRET